LVAGGEKRKGKGEEEVALLQGRKGKGALTWMETRQRNKQNREYGRKGHSPLLKKGGGVEERSTSRNILYFTGGGGGGGGGGRRI